MGRYSADAAARRDLSAGRAPPRRGARRARRALLALKAIDDEADVWLTEALPPSPRPSGAR
jgi:hypothetical protein